MTDIDWSKAPEGAQYYSASDDGFYTFYRHIEESTYEIFYCGGTRWVLHVGTPEEHYTIIPRPAPAWNGEGLPPIGTVCEWEHEANKGNWHKAEIKYIGSAYVIVADLAGFEQHHYLQTMQFRPIRTPEQIAAELADRAIKEIAGIICRDGAFDIDDPEVTESAVALYDAGYRKA